MADIKGFPKWFNNRMATLEKMITSQTQTILVEIAEETVEKMRDYLQTHWYDTYNPLEYDRTGDLKDAIRYTIDGRTINIYFDRRRIRAIKRKGTWSAHMGFDGVSFIEGLINWIDEGGNGGLSPRTDDGIDLLGYAEQKINKAINKKATKRINVIIKQTLK